MKRLPKPINALRAHIQRHGLSDGEFAAAGTNPNASQIGVSYDTGVDGTAFFRTLTNAGGGTGGTRTATGYAIAADTVYTAKIVMSASQVDFYIATGTGAFTLVGTHTTHIPSGSMNYAAGVLNLAATEKRFKWTRGWVRHR